MSGRFPNIKLGAAAAAAVVAKDNVPVLHTHTNAHIHKHGYTYTLNTLHSGGGGVLRTSGRINIITKYKSKASFITKCPGKHINYNHKAETPHKLPALPPLLIRMHKSCLASRRHRRRHRRCRRPRDQGQQRFFNGYGSVHTVAFYRRREFRDVSG